VQYIVEKWRHKMRRSLLRMHLEYPRTMVREFRQTLQGQDRAARERGIARFYRYYRTLFLSYYQEGFFRRFDDAALAAMKYVYFPMHKEAEMAQTFQAPLWQDQRNTVRVLASMLPFGYQLLVREHRMNYGRRPTRTYRELEHVPNVILVDPFDSQFKYLRHADLIVTENGSSGWEGLLLGRRVLLLAENFYQGAGQGLMVKDPDALNAAILSLLARPSPDTAELDLALGCMLDAEVETTFPMSVEGIREGLKQLTDVLAPHLQVQNSSVAEL